MPTNGSLTEGDFDLTSCSSFSADERLSVDVDFYAVAALTDYVAAVPALDGWPAAPDLATARLRLEPLRVEHAEQLAPLLDDQGLHTFIGGHPATVDELRGTYARQVVGHSPDGAERWLNWIMRHHPSGAAVGTVQATVRTQDGGTAAELAWVVASAYQRRGYGREAATAIAEWLRQHGAQQIIAHIHPEHDASMAIARALGLAPTSVRVDGEVRWVG